MGVCVLPALVQAKAITAFPDSFEVFGDFRSFDGSYPAAADPDYGRAGTRLRRRLPSGYGDGGDSPSGDARPNPRQLSNQLGAQTAPKPNTRGLSDMVWAFGQMLAHDTNLTQPPTLAPEAFDIPIPPGDSVGVAGAIPFERSRFDPATGGATPRQQINQITSWIDASFVYGSDAARAGALRANDGSGRLRTSAGDMPPVDPSGQFVAGDERANENPALTALHTLFLREHNRLADGIKAADAGLSGDQIYHRAREIVAAQVQAITVNEYLPTILGSDALSDYAGQRDDVDPSVSNVFSTGTFRFGHTQLSNEFHFRFGDGATEVRPLGDCFFNPSCLQDVGVDAVFRGLADRYAQTIDNQVVDAVRNNLITGPGPAILVDLFALNIQRGRDHGLPSYEDARLLLGLDAPGDTDLPIPRHVIDAYSDNGVLNPDGIDFWVGALAEEAFGDGVVGELLHTVLKEQFEALRDGDPFWYAGDRFDTGTVAWLDSLTLADLIRWNTGVDDVQAKLFFTSDAKAVPGPPGWSLFLLALLTSVGLRRWRVARFARAWAIADHAVGNESGGGDGGLRDRLFHGLGRVMVGRRLRRRGREAGRKAWRPVPGLRRRHRGAGRHAVRARRPRRHRVSRHGGGARLVQRSGLRPVHCAPQHGLQGRYSARRRRFLSIPSE